MKGAASLRDGPSAFPLPGEGTQTGLQEARAVIVGLGAIGGVVARILSDAGVGFLRLVDRDVVERRNLPGQALYEQEDVGVPKAVAGGKRLLGARGGGRVEACAKDLNRTTVARLLDGIDIVVDGTDNLSTRYLLNEACIARGIPFLFGGVRGSEGMVSPLHPPKTPCFRCLLPTPLAPDEMDPCETGVADAAPLVGNLLASQALRFLLTGMTAPGIFVVRSDEPDIERLGCRPRPGCPTCEGRIQEFLDDRRRGPRIVRLCGGDAVSYDPGDHREISLEALAEGLEPVGHVRLTPYLLSVEVAPYGLSVFPDGRALLRGVPSLEEARALYERYVTAR